jgi:hypothetical protein
MNNEALAELIKSTKEHIDVLKNKMENYKNYIAFQESCMENAKCREDWCELGEIAHDIASVYFNLESCQDEIDYLEKQIAKHQ